MKQTMERILSRTWLQLDWPLIRMVLTIKGLVLLFGAFSYELMQNRRIESLRSFFEIWNRWDAPHYLDLAQYGYQATGEMRLWLVFYPLFPGLTRLFAIIYGDYLISAFIVSTLASVAAAILLQRLVQLDYSAELAQRAVWFLFIFPTSYFLHIGYTESLFIALLLGCFLAARKERWMLVGMLGAFACLTRVNGLILIPALGVEALLQFRKTRRWQWQWLWIGAVAIGIGGYLLINYQVTGNPLGFLKFQEEHWNRTLAWPWTGIYNMARQVLQMPNIGHMMVQELVFMALGLASTVAAWIKLRPSYAVWMTGNWLLFTSSSWALSVPRYTLILFPIYILFAMLAEKRSWEAVISLWSVWFLTLFTSAFVQGGWAF